MSRRGGRRGPDDERVPVPVEGYTQPGWECECRKLVRRLFGAGGLNERDQERLRAYLREAPAGGRAPRDPVEAARQRKERQRLLDKIRALIGLKTPGKPLATIGDHSDVTLWNPGGRIALRAVRKAMSRCFRARGARWR